MTAKETRSRIQLLLNVKADGSFGPKTQAAYDELKIAGPNMEWPPVTPTPGTIIHTGKASSFADPADVAAFRRCKARGGSDQECFKVGDNGVGKWGDDTTVNTPMCALPPEDWQEFGAAARGKKVLVMHSGSSVVCELRDTMPHKANIKNGAMIDLNPAAVKALGLTPPIMVTATWQWL